MGALVPTGLAATAISSAQIDLHWTDASSDEIGFKVERSASADGPFTEIAAPAAGETTYSDSGLTASTPYYYRVRAYNTAGRSRYSKIASATTLKQERPDEDGDEDEHEGDRPEGDRTRDGD